MNPSSYAPAPACNRSTSITAPGNPPPHHLLRLRSPAYDYAPFGLPTLTEDSGGLGTTQNPYTFKTGIQDRVTGWVKYGARWYSPTTGRWSQQDTLDTPLNPNNANRYAYAANDPINNTDPTGLFSLGDIGSAIASTVVGSVATGLSVVAKTSVQGAVAVGAGACIGSALGEVVGTAIDGGTSTLGDVGAACAVGIGAAVLGGAIGTGIGKAVANRS